MRTYSKFFCTVAWTCTFFFLLIDAAQFVPIPQSVRIPRLLRAIPTTEHGIRSKHYQQNLTRLATVILDSRILLVGDSSTMYAPWPYPRITLPGAISENIPEAILNYSGPDPDRCVIMTGTWLMARNREYAIPKELGKIKKALSARFPNASISVISHGEIHEIAQKYSFDGGWHLTPEGYDVLKNQHLALFTL